MNVPSRTAIWVGVLVPLVLLLGLVVLAPNVNDPGPVIAFMAVVPLLAAMVTRPLIAGIVALATVIAASVSAALIYGQSFADALPIVIGVILAAGIAVIASQAKAAPGWTRTAPPARRPASAGALAEPPAAADADTDALTGLPSRRHVELAVVDGVRQRPNVVAMIDIDDLAGANDRLGRDIGDVFLFAVGGRTRYALAEGDIVARWDGGRFLVIMAGDLTSAAPTLGLIADKVNAHPIRTDSGLVPATISVGVAPWPIGGDFDDACTLSRRAMHEAKAQGGGCVRVVGQGGR